MIKQGDGKCYRSSVLGYYRNVTAKDDYQRYLEGIHNPYYIVWNSKAIVHGKEHRRPYGKDYGNYAKSVDRSCRNHDACPWCEGNRTYKYRKRAAGMTAAMKDMEDA